MSTPAFPVVTSPVSGVAGSVVPSAQFPVVTSPESTLPIVQVPIVNQSAYDLGLGSGNPHAVDHARYSDSTPYSGLINPPAFGSAAFHDVASNGNATTSQVVLGSDTRLQGTGVGGNYLAANDPSVTNARMPLSHAASHGQNGTDPLTLTKAQISDFPAVVASDWNTLANKPATFPPDGTVELVARKGQPSGYAGLGVDGKVPGSQLPAASGGTITWTDVANKPSTFPPDSTAELVARKGQASGYAGLGTDGKVPSGQLPPIASDWNTLANKPTTFSPALHAASHGNGAADAVTIVKAQVSDFPSLGTASARDVPASGDAGNTQAVLGSDSRLAQVATNTAGISTNSSAITAIQGDSRWTNARAPTAHASTHVGGSDAIAQASSVLVGLCPMVDNVTIQVVASKLTTVALAWTAITGKPTTFTPAAHAASHGNGQADAVTLTKAQISDFPTLGTASPLDVAASGNASSTQVVKGNDGRLSDSRTPSAHAPTHRSGGSDALRLDELAAPTDVTTSDASTSAHGLLPKLSGVASTFLNGEGAYSTPAGGGDMSKATYDTVNRGYVDRAVLSDSATAVAYSGVTGKPTLGTASAKDIPSSGDASTGQVVYGTDTRLTNSRTPTAHQATHVGGSDAIPVATSLITGLCPVLDNSTIVVTASKLAVGAVPNASVTGLGNAALLTAPGTGVNATSGQLVKGDDSRLTDSRTPAAHSASHKAAGGDAIKLDEFAAPTDVTTLNASASAHGLLPKLSNVATQFLNGVGAYATPSGAGDMLKSTYDTANRGYVDRSVLADSASAVAYANVTGTPTLGTSASKDIPSSGNASAIQVVYGSDTRLSDSRTPSAHAATHAPGSSDALAAATATVGGAVPTPPNNTNKWYRGDSSWTYDAQATETNGTFTVPAAGSTVVVTIQSAAWTVVGQTLIITDGTRIGFFEITVVTSSTSITVANRGYLGNSVSGTMATGSTVRLMGPGFATATQPGFVPIPPNDATKVLTGAMTYAAVAYANVTGTPTLGTSAAKDIPSSGDASTGQVVYGTDTRLTNSRAPTAHQASHVGGSDAIPVATSLITGLCPVLDNATIVVTSSKLAVGAVPNASVTGLGNAALLTAPGAAVNATSGQLVKGDDTRLTDTRTPAAHAASHKNGGSDAVKLDELAATTDVTTLNSSSTAHGLLPKLSNVVTQYLTGTGSWAVPAGTAGDMLKATYDTATRGYVDRAVLADSASAVTYANVSGKPTFFTTTTNGTFTVPAAAGSQAIVIVAATWPVVGQTVFITDGTLRGFFEITVVTDTTHITILNRAYLGNSVSGTMATAATVELHSPGVATATQPGLVPVPPNVVTQFFNGQSAFTTPPTVTRTAAGYAPASGGTSGTVNVLREDLTWAAVAYSSLTGTPTLGTSSAKDIPASGNASTGQVVYGTDTRLTDSRTPATHASTHQAGGGDSLALDTLAAPTDITTLNSSTTAHGLLAKLSNVASQYLDGTGAWSTPAGGGGTSAITTTNASFTCPAAGATVSVTFTSTTGFAAGMGLYISGAGLFNVSSVTDATHAVVLNLGVTGNAVSGTIATAKNVWLAGVATVATATLPGYVPTPSNTATQFLNGQMGYTVPVLDALGATTDITTLNTSTTAHGLMPKLGNVASAFYNGIGTQTVPLMKPFKVWVVGLEGSPPSTLYATFAVQNNRPHLAFNDAATWGTLLFGVVPTGASLGGGFIVRLKWKSITATTGNARWNVALERMNTAQNADSLDTAVPFTSAVSGTQHALTEAAITITTIDSMVAGDGFMLQVQRLGADAADTLVGDACMVLASIETVN